jgi:hypothetical protein
MAGSLLMMQHAGYDPFPHFDEKPPAPFDNPDGVEIEEGEGDDDDDEDFDIDPEDNK